MKKRLLKILSILIVTVCSVFILTACVDADHVVEIDKLRSKGYVIHDITTSGGYDTMGAKAAYECVINDTDGNPAEFVRLLYFASDHDAIIFSERFEEFDIFTIDEEAIEDKGYNHIRIGKIFIHGTDYAFKDALS